MEEEKMETPTQSGHKQQPIDLLSKDELTQKYKSLLAIARKAKQAKDETFEENRKLKELLQQHETQKEADKQALLTMKEMLEAYTENKLQLTNKVSELEKQYKLKSEGHDQLAIENESLKRQVHRLTEDNDSLLVDIENMEKQLEQVGGLAKEQKAHLTVLEQEVNKLKTMEIDNNRLLAENDLSIKALAELKEKYAFVKEINAEQRLKFNALKDRFLEVHRKLKKLKECKRILLETQHEYADSVSQWQKEIIKASNMLCKELSVLKLENMKLLKELEMKSNASTDVAPAAATVAKLNELWSICSRVNEEYGQLKLENNKLKEKLAIMQCNNAERNPTLEREHSARGQDELIITKEKINYLLHLSKRAMEEYKSKQETTISSSFIMKLNQIENLAAKVFRENQTQYLELQQLKNAQEEFNLSRKESDSSNTTLQTKLVQTEQLLEEAQQIYQQKEREHCELLGEMRELNEALKARGDMISRQQEEQQHLKSEFKLNLENLQKMQENLNGKDQELQVKHQQLASATEDISNAKQKISTLEAQNDERLKELEMLKTMQIQTVDAADNQSDILSTSTISKAEELQRFRDVEDAFEEKYNKLRAIAAKLKKKLQDETAIKQNLEKELKTNEHAQQQLQKHTDELQALKIVLNDKQQQIDLLSKENQKLKNSRKQANVLNLEIEAAEKSLTDATTKLAARSQELHEANECVKSKENTIEQLRKEIHLLEASKQSEIKHSQELRTQIDHLQATLRDTVHDKQQAFDKMKILEQDVENLKLELESVKLELASFTSTADVTLSALKVEKDQILSKLCNCQEELSSCEKLLKQAERAHEDLRVEYLDYKIKAQAVLRKNQTRDSSKDRELEEELNNLKFNELELKSNLEKVTNNMELLEKEKQMLADDNHKLQQRCTVELAKLIEELRLQNDALSQDMQQQQQQMHETLKQHCKQLETIDEVHKQQVSALNAKHHNQMEQLRKELTQNVRLPPSIGAAVAKHSNTALDILDQQNKLDYLLMEREDAEGSEEAETLANLAASRKISTTSKHSAVLQHDFMPLDELLSTPMQAINSETLLVSASDDTSAQYQLDNSKNSDFIQLELNTTKERLQKQESRVRHLTALLAENEQDLARLTQMNEMLKEELRRQERSVEREQHMNNSEYVKNVVMKFLTLNNADEKTRLVPVLNTILKLSRSETEMLNCVAKGQKVTDSNSRTSGGWGNFLPWSSGGNNN